MSATVPARPSCVAAHQPLAPLVAEPAVEEAACLLDVAGEDGVGPARRPRREAPLQPPARSRPRAPPWPRRTTSRCTPRCRHPADGDDRAARLEERREQPVVVSTALTRLRARSPCHRSESCSRLGAVRQRVGQVEVAAGAVDQDVQPVGLESRSECPVRRPASVWSQRIALGATLSGPRPRVPVSSRPATTTVSPDHHEPVGHGQAHPLTCSGHQHGQRSRHCQLLCVMFRSKRNRRRRMSTTGADEIALAVEPRAARASRPRRSARPPRLGGRPSCSPTTGAAPWPGSGSRTRPRPAEHAHPPRAAVHPDHGGARRTHLVMAGAISQRVARPEADGPGPARPPTAVAAPSA